VASAAYKDAGLKEHPELTKIVEPVLQMVEARRPASEVAAALAFQTERHRFDVFNRGIAMAMVLQQIERVMGRDKK
jgi:hypothetical protein